MKTRTKFLLVTICAVMLVAATVFGTLAYLTDSESVKNTFTVGRVGISLDEAPVDTNGHKIDEERVHTNAYHLLPGHEYDKDPTVHVDAGSEACYVRMYVTITQSEEWDAICDQYKKDDMVTNLFGAEDMFLGLNENWVAKGNQENLAAANTRTYEFWYKEAVAKSETQTDLPALFTGLKIPGELTNQDMEKLGEDFAIYVVAQAIQAGGFGDAAAAFAEAPALSGADLMPTP